MSLIYMPKLAMGMEEGTIIQWLVENGDAVTAGQAIYLLESDKVETEVDCDASGKISIEAEAGETLPVGTLIAEIIES